MSDDNLDIEDTTDLINQDALTQPVLNDIIPIKYLKKTSTRRDGITYYDFIEENTNLRSFMPSFTGFARVPGGTSDLRGMFNDLNGLLVRELERKYPNHVTLSYTTKTNCNNKGWRRDRSNIHSRYNNMCFYCGKTCKKKLQCDHVIPIMQMYISLERDDYLYFNFERVHSKCNNIASNMTLNDMWQQIGTSTFPGPHDESFVSFNIKKQDGTLIKDYKVDSTNRQAICRGYLAYNILSKLTFSSLDIQSIRASLMKDVVNKYLEFKTLAGKLLSEQGTVAQSLLDFSQSPQSYKRPRTSFGTSSIKLVNVIPSDLKDKKWTAIFSKDSKIVKTHFGAKGMSDYTIHKDIDRRNRYISRHLKDLDTRDPTRAGYLSMFVLWNKPSFSASVKDYQERLKIYNKTGKFPSSITGYSKLSKFGVNPVAQLARYQPVVLPDDILRKIDQEHILPPKKIAWQLKKYLPKRRQSFYLAQEFDNPDPYSEPIEFYPEDYSIAEYLELLAKYNTKPSILQHKDILAHIFINFKWSIDDPGTYLTQEQKLNKLKSKKYFIEVMKKLGFKLSFKNFSRDIKNPELDKFFDISGTNFGTPANVVNKTLYKKVKEQIKSGIKGRRWGAYDSGRLVQMYKQLGGKYSGTKKETPLERWYKEKWVNACKWPQVVPCGRSDMTNKMAYCRPSIKVTKNTPKTVQSLTQAQINKRCKIKEKTPLVRISGQLKV